MGRYFVERQDDGGCASKTLRDAIHSLMKIVSHFLQKKVLNIFPKTSSGVIPSPTISARRKRHSHICRLNGISEIRTVCPFSIRLKSIYNSIFSTKRKEVHLIVSRVKFTNKFINSYIHI